MIVDLVTVAVALDDALSTVDAACERPVLEHAFLAPQPRGAAELRLHVAPLDAAVAVLPLGDERDDRMRRLGLEFGAVGAVEMRDVPRVFDHRELHAEADAEVRHALLAC